MTTIRLGYQIPSGEPVMVPLKHLAITGQTQEAGKTTALEALIARSQLSAITFVTKRGEGSFRQARRIKPYFREQADWQYVASVLEASRGEKLKFERAWIIRASKGAKTLADVQRNVRKQLETAKGLSGDVYLTLDAYLDVVVPAIARIEWASRVDLGAGVNVMDLSSVPAEMQHLCIKSTLDWVLDQANGVIVVIPEAWKFLPQGRGTPVKLSAEAFIRQAAAMRNYLWLDSQDLGGIEKTILRSVAVWIIGVQREANEIKRTLDNIPAGVSKPNDHGIATLGLGEFYACWGAHVVKTYVQPALMGSGVAQSVAKRLIPVSSFAVPPFVEQEEDMSRVTDLEAQIDKLTEEVQRLSRENEALRSGTGRIRIDAVPVDATEPPKAGRVRETGAGGGGALPVQKMPWDQTNPISDDAETLYQRIRARLLEEKPTLLKILGTRPELVVEIEPRLMTVDGASMKGRVARLMAQGWFSTAHDVGEVRRELTRTGTDPGGGGALGIMLWNFVKDGFLLREGGGFTLSPSVKVTEKQLTVV